MLTRSLRRTSSTSTLLRLFCLIIIIWTWIEASSIHSTLSNASKGRSSPPPNKEKIFIASLPWNNEIILRTHWINQLKDLVKVLGIGNVYVSIYENGSYDGTKDALRDLYKELDSLGVRCTMTLEDTSHGDVIAHTPSKDQKHDGWIKHPKLDHLVRRRIDYLADLRNTVLEPLWQLESKGEHFSKVLFLNDIVYTPNDILTLLNTRNGLYAAACALDFEAPPAFYDTFALRDSDGHPAIMQTWPYFRSAASRSAVLRNAAVPVKSCWNGAVVFDATPFYTTRWGMSRATLKFRGVADSLAQKHVEGSECCLIHADNPLSGLRTMRGVWVNPDVRVGYCDALLHQSRIARPWEEYKAMCQTSYDYTHVSGRAWVSTWQIAKGLWSNRIRRWFSVGRSAVGGTMVRRLARWQAEAPAKGAEKPRAEPGDFCLVDEMQVLAVDGWRHL